jgi:hypothetical protein
MNSLFNHNAMKELRDKKMDVPYLFTENRELLNTFFNLLNSYYNSTQINLQEILVVNQNAIRLIDYFKNKYHLD